MVLKQLWIVVLPDGAAFDAGASYHLSVADRDSLVNEIAARLATDMAGEREEPLGDPVEVPVRRAYFEKIQQSPHGLRVR